MQLRQPEALRVFNQHDGGVWHIDAYFNDSSTDEYARQAATKTFHNPLLFRRGNASMEQFAGEWQQTLAPFLKLSGSRFRLKFFALVNQRINDISLPARFQFAAQKCEHVRQFFLVACCRRDPSAVRRHLVDCRDIEIAVEAHGEGARNRRRGHHQHIRRRLARRQAAALRDAEFVLFIDHDQAWVFQSVRLVKQRMGADKDLARRAVVRCGFSLRIRTRPPPFPIADVARCVRRATGRDRRAACDSPDSDEACWQKAATGPLCARRSARISAHLTAPASGGGRRDVARRESALVPSRPPENPPRPRVAWPQSPPPFCPNRRRLAATDSSGRSSQDRRATLRSPELARSLGQKAGRAKNAPAVLPVQQ